MNITSSSTSTAINDSVLIPSSTALHRNLGLWHIIIIGLAYIQPMTLFDTFGLVSDASNFHVPTSYIFALVAILLTSISYGQMIQRFPSAGSAYTYAQQSIHPNVGFMVGWSSWLDYLLSPMVNIILAKIYLEALFPEVNGWVWVIGLTGLMTAVNMGGAKFVAHFNSWIVFLQILIIAYFTHLVYHQLHIGKNFHGTIADQVGAPALWSSQPFWKGDTSISNLITGATLLCFSFTGFDALSSLAEETKNTKRTLPKAIIATSLIAGVIFIIATYFMQLYFPGDPKQYFEDINATQPDVLKIVGGAVFQSWVLGFAIVTVMASGISAHAGVSRLMYVMGRDNVINKKIFGHLSPNSRVPTYNIIMVGIVALAAGKMEFNQILSLISFGALTAFSFVNLSVIAKYAVQEKRYKTPADFFKYVLMPLLGFLCIVALWINIEEEALRAGLIWAAIGIVYLAYITGGFKRPAPVHHEFHEE